MMYGMNTMIWVLGGIKAVADFKVYTAGSVLDLLQFFAPKMMNRGGAQFSYGIADDLDDKKYEHYKYWSNPLETKLPSAPDMEILSMYGVGVPQKEHMFTSLLLPLNAISLSRLILQLKLDMKALYKRVQGTQSGAHVDITGNFALIEDIIRVAAGATGEDLGGDRVYSDIFKWARQEGTRLLTPRDKELMAGDDLVKGIYV
ncbi:hypothetical protein ACH5RR_006338 [Cinchona calisaya]|uniref:Uncharacterized protein n=1 Tax=Cinchona calisaya TaxID=153742 RepID=A0ABD3ANQ2_9GENT